MKLIEETIVAGKTILKSLKVPSGKHSGKRNGRLNVTKEAVQKNNYRLAVRKLTADLNANFDETCAHFTLTYKGNEPTQEQAKKDRKNFLITLRRYLRKNNIELKYVAATEYENKRIHHHIVLNTQDVALVNKLWGKGYVKSSILDNTGNYRKLAEYLIKETEKTFRLPDSAHKQRYTTSKNLVRPIVKREYVSVKRLSEDPQPLQGYEIPKSEIRKYEHPVTGLEHLEYIMIALDKPRRYKIWPRGKIVNNKEYFKINSIEEQERMW